MAAHGKYLAANPGVRVRLEGHADERGSREYNIGLGERRAQAVKQALLLQGAGASQLTTVSYGEERPGGDRQRRGILGAESPRRNRLRAVSDLCMRRHATCVAPLSRADSWR